MIRVGARSTFGIVPAGLAMIAVTYGLARFAYGLFLSELRGAFGLDAAMLWLTYMAHTKKHLIGTGVRFTNTFATNPWCCPSRATIFRGQYSHNTGMWYVNPPEGGYPALVENSTQSSTAATWMRGAGYATAYVGTYL